MKTSHGDPIAFRPDAEMEKDLDALRERLPLKPSEFARLAARYVWPRLLSGEISMLDLGQANAAEPKEEAVAA